MILGFISLLLTFGQTYIAKICVPEKVVDSMLPCAYKGSGSSTKGETRRRLLWNERRSLAAASASSCKTVRAYDLNLSKTGFYFAII